MQMSVICDIYNYVDEMSMQSQGEVCEHLEHLGIIGHFDMCLLYCT